MLKKCKLTVFAISLLVLASFASVAPQLVQAQSVTIRFATNGLAQTNDNIFRIDGLYYNYWNMPTLTWVVGSTHSVEAFSPLTGTSWPPTDYYFASWTNGNGLTAASGTFTTPASDVTVTANYGTASVVSVQFATNGLAATNDNVFRIDGTEYNYWNIPTFTWVVGLPHSVEALSPLTGTSWPPTDYYFASWTNGNGLTTASGTFTTPETGVTVTANYGTTAPPEETALTITCAPDTIDTTSPDTTTTITGCLTSDGSGVAGKTITLTYFDGFDWISITSVTTAADGTYTHSWEVPTDIENGDYPVKAEFAGDSNYADSSAVTGSCGNGSNLLVLPEYAWGALAAMLACFGGLMFFKVRRSPGSKRALSLK